MPIRRRGTGRRCSASRTRRSPARRSPLQLLLPPMVPDSTELFPCVLFVQGSAWFEQSLGLSLPPLAEFSRSGYVIAAVK